MILLPDLICDSVCDLTPEFLSQNGVCTLLLDFDNTIMAYTEDTPSPDVLCWLDALKQSGVTLCVVSNTKRGRAPNFAKTHGIDCIVHARKPFQRGIHEAKRRFGVQGVALVGDQIYTDVLGANCGGLISILIKPIRLHNFWLRARHFLEKPWIAMRRRRIESVRTR